MFEKYLTQTCFDIQQHKIDIKKLIMKKSVIGEKIHIFADDNIPSDTIFAINNHLLSTDDIFSDKYIHDLAWNGNKETYVDKENLEKNINTVIIVECINRKNYFLDSGGGEYPIKNVYLKSLREIKKGEELSRFYGLDYWTENN